MIYRSVAKCNKNTVVSANQSLFIHERVLFLSHFRKSARIQEDVVLG